MTAPAALVVDFGGVLTTDLWESIRACARRLGLADNALVDLLATDAHIHPLFIAVERGDVGQGDFETELATAAGVPADGLLTNMCADLRPNRPMLDAVDVLRAAGVRVGVLSNSWGTGPFDPYRGYDLEQRVDAVVISDRVGLRKPEPAIFGLILDRLGAQPAAAVFVDDVVSHLGPAAALGLATIHHVDSTRTLDELERAFAVDLRSPGPSALSGRSPDRS